ncbi:MAG: hypothetical protein ACYCX4_05250 [Bacillota bacterium]
METQDPRAIKINMVEMAKALGNSRVSVSIAVGAILKLFSENIDIVHDILQRYVKEEYLEINIKAVMEGYNIVEKRFPRLNGNFSDWISLSGSKALSLGVIAAGLKFYSAYPMSPSTPKKILGEKAAAARQIINIEQNATGQLAGLIREQTGIVCASSILKYDGQQISGEEIVERVLKGVL